MKPQKEIDDIITMAKHKPANKKYLLKKIMDNFFDELEQEFVEWFSSNGIMR